MAAPPSNFFPIRVSLQYVGDGLKTESARIGEKYFWETAFIVLSNDTGGWVSWAPGPAMRDLLYAATRRPPR
jgi:hypothetical protein